MSKYYLKEITSKIGSGATPTGGKDAYKGGDYALIRSQNVLDMSFSKEGLVYINDEQAKKLDGVKVESGDVLFNITGDSICRCCVVPDDILPARVNQHVAIIRPTNVSSHFIMYYLQYMKPYLMSICGNGSSRNALTKENLENLIVDIPEETDLIADILSLLDNKINNNNKINAELESMTKTIYNYWFLQFEFPNEDGKPYKSSGGKMVWNEELKREIPEGWEVKELLDFCTWESASQPPKSTFLYKPTEGYIRFIQNRDYESDENITYVPFTNSTKTCDEYDILIDKYGDKTAGMVRYGIKGAYNVALGKITPKIADSQEYIRCYLASKQIFNYLHNACMASTRSSMNETVFKGMMVPIPNKRIMEMFSIFNREIINKCLKIKDENRELAALRDFLLPMLMNGQIGFKDGER